MSDRGGALIDNTGGEKLTVEERLRLARKKRAQQVKKYAQHEKHMDKEIGKKKKKNNLASRIGRGAKVRFAENIMLLEAASRNDVDEVRQMLGAGVNPNMSNDDGLTALHQSCIDNSEDMMKLLISFGADVNARDSELWSPLHAAATCGQQHLCKLLIQSGADLLSVNGDGNMPYDICEHESALDYIESEMAKRGITQEIIDRTRLVPEKSMLADLTRMIEGGFSLEFRGSNGETPLHIAATNGYVEVTQFLLDHKASVVVTDQDLWQPIHCATYWCQVPVVELLLRHGASLDARTRSGESAIDICGDAETKKKILSLKKELGGSTRDFKSRLLSRQRSSSIRRGSVKRSSMKEKKALSLKVAREEGRFLQNVETQNEEDEDNAAAEDEPNQSQAKQSEPDQPADGFKDRLITRTAVRIQNRNSSKSGPLIPDDIQLDERRQNTPVSTSGLPNYPNAPSNETAIEKSSSNRNLSLVNTDGGEKATPCGLDADFEQQYADDSIRLSDTTSPLIQKTDDLESSNGLKKHSSQGDVSNCQLGKGVFVGRSGRCCKDCCVIL